jgi:hypothetical protein
MSIEGENSSISESARSITRNPLMTTSGPWGHSMQGNDPVGAPAPGEYAPVYDEAPQPSEEQPLDRLAQLESYIENYVQPLAESMQKVVSKMEVMDSDLKFLAKRVGELRDNNNENEVDMLGLMRAVSALQEDVALLKQYNNNTSEHAMDPLIQIHTPLETPLDRHD